ncbi:hypothetical protein I4U23_002041 [Adineta vaga]|nr:hypothetical protein I4U23_002041 [Adineta vaga]
MAMYNSATNSNQDDGDVTMISHSLFYKPPKGARHFNSSSYVSDRNNNIFDDDNEVDISEAVQQIEQVLEYYRKELKQESYTQLDCNRKLITRLFDFIRPTYSTHKKKMDDLNILFEDISTLQDLRFIRVKDKHEQLTSEVLQLKKLLITSANEGHSCRNTITKAYRANPMISYEQWMAMEEDARKLNNLVELQRDRINELINLISQEDTSSLQTSSSRHIFAHFDELPTRKRQSATSSANTERLLVATIQSIVDEQHDSGYNQSDHSVKRNIFLESIRICPFCQAIFNKSTSDDEQFQEHIDAHT